MKIQQMIEDKDLEITQVYFGKDDQRLTVIFQDNIEDTFEKYGIFLKKYDYDPLKALQEYDPEIKEYVYDDEVFICSECGKYSLIDINYINNYIVINNVIYGVSCGCALEKVKENILSYESDYIEASPLLYDEDFEHWLKTNKFKKVEEDVDVHWDYMDKAPLKYTAKYYPDEDIVIVGIINVHQFGGSYDIWIKEEE